MNKTPMEAIMPEYCESCGHLVGPGNVGRLSYDVDGELLCEYCYDDMESDQ